MRGVFPAFLLFMAIEVHVVLPVVPAGGDAGFLFTQGLLDMSSILPPSLEHVFVCCTKGFRNSFLPTRVRSFFPVDGYTSVGHLPYDSVNGAQPATSQGFQP